MVTTLKLIVGHLTVWVVYIWSRVMGTVKDQMKPTDAVPRTASPRGNVNSSKLDKLRELLRAKTPDDATLSKQRRTEAPRSFVDTLLEARDLVVELIKVKQADLSTEKGNETKNQIAIARLSAIEFHVQSALDGCDEYVNS